MNQKWPLFTGILLLVLGIVFRMLQLKASIFVPFFAVGGVLKLYYIITIIRKGNYKPGWEMLFLVVGLTLFFIGIILKNQYQTNIYLYWMIPGLSLKIVFVLLFIFKIRQSLNL